MTVAGIIGLVIVIVVPFQEKLVSRLIAWMPLPSRISQIVSAQVARFLSGCVLAQRAQVGNFYPADSCYLVARWHRECAWRYILFHKV